MELLEHTVTSFTEQLASSPVPGGGGASALVGAIGIALGEMVGELTIGKKKYADVEDEIKELMGQAQKLRVRLLACVQKDADAFAPLARAYGFPKENPRRDEVMETCLRDAAAPPLEIFDLCCEAIELHRKFAEKGSRLVISDAATGAMLCWGAMYGAAINVKVNTRMMKDRDYAVKINAHIDAQMAKYRPIAESIYENIYQRFS